MICLALTGPDFEENRKALATYRQWTDIAELRIDRLRHGLVNDCADFMNRAFAEFGIAFVVTIRLIEDGGAWAHGEVERRAAFDRILSHVEPGVVAWIDLEGTTDWPEIELMASAKNVGIIRSYHNFSGTPADLETMMKGMYREAGDMVKAAVMTRGSMDLLALITIAESLRALDRPFILVGMGPFGVATRILARILGSTLTYASSALQGHVPAAPGHMDPRLLSEQFRYHKIGTKTRVCGIIGNPVMHSRSPAYHNARFAEKDIDAVYVPFQVDHLPSFFALAERLGIVGFSVTIPHKEGVIPFLESRDELVHQIGSCNTVVRRPEGWAGTNTDAQGFFLPLEGLLRGEQRTRALVIGAGGAARGVVQVLLSHGFSVLVLNRTIDRARQIATDFSHWYPGMIEAAVLPEKLNTPGNTFSLTSDQKNRILVYTQVIVQTTSIGMDSEDPHADPLSWYHFDGSELVYDIIYTPPLTPLLARAQASGCRILNGLPMFDEQARLQSELFTSALVVSGSPS